MILVVPTRNRAELATRALASCPGARVLVSDNSTDEDERSRLAAVCARSGVEVVRPPTPMSMGDHWEWACAEAAARWPDEPLSVMTDRMVWKRGALARLERVAMSVPDHIVTFLHDAVWDDASPIRVQLAPWSGDVAEIPSRRFLELAARGRRHASAPRLLNCVVPARVVRAIRGRFGTLCAGQSPDYAFGFRALALEPAIVHLDEALQIGHGMARSNGAAHARGLATRDAVDYRRDLPEAASASPVPGLVTPLNVITHEYVLVRRVVPELPELDVPAVLGELAREAAGLLDEMGREATLARLRAAGWRGTPPRRSGFERVRRLPAFRRPVTAARRVATWATRLLRDQTGHALLDARQLVFDDVEDALRAVEDWPRPPGPPTGPQATRRWSMASREGTGEP